MSCAVHRTSDMLTTSLTGADASMSAFTTPRIYTCLTDATFARALWVILRGMGQSAVTRARPAEREFPQELARAFPTIDIVELASARISDGDIDEGCRHGSRMRRGGDFGRPAGPSAAGGGLSSPL